MKKSIKLFVMFFVIVLACVLGGREGYAYTYKYDWTVDGKTTNLTRTYRKNSTGDYLVNLAVPDNCDKKYAWFEVNVPKAEIDKFSKGKYLIYISGTVSNETFYGELEDVQYTDFTNINKSLGHDITRNENLRFRLELNVK